MLGSVVSSRAYWLRAFLLCCLGGMAVPAYAHVKWFSKVVNCISTPASPETAILSPLFMALLSGALATMALVFHVETRLLYSPATKIYPPAHLKRQISVKAAMLLRLAVAAYFLTLALPMDGQYFILTPEMITQARWVPVVQVIIAATAIWKRSAPIAAAGILLLYFHGGWVLGGFHMLDYPYFIGIAVFMLIDALSGVRQHFLGLAILRFCTGFSFMWVAVEKWLYPNWTYDLLQRELQVVTMGIDHTFFVMAAGFVEFSLGFLLIFGRLSSQVASLVLLVLLLAAIPLVGKLDAIGHAPIIVVLAIFAVTQNRIGYASQDGGRWGEGRHVISYAISVPGLIGLYYFTHVIWHPSNGEVNPSSALFALVLLLPLCWRMVFTRQAIFPVRKRVTSNNDSFPPPLYQSRRSP